jgi:hypothetical protein
MKNSLELIYVCMHFGCDAGSQAECMYVCSLQRFINILLRIHISSGTCSVMALSDMGHYCSNQIFFRETNRSKVET